MSQLSVSTMWRVDVNIGYWTRPLGWGADLKTSEMAHELAHDLRKHYKDVRVVRIEHREFEETRKEDNDV